MNEDIKILLEEYGDPNFYNSFLLGRIPDIFDIQKGRRFLEEYLIGHDDFLGNYQSLFEKVFLSGHSFDAWTGKIFRDDFSFTVKAGGYPLDDLLWRIYTEISRRLGGSEIIVVQEEHFKNGLLRREALRFRFPVQTPWEKLLEGNVFSVPICCNDYDAFHIFDDTGEWGVFFSAEYWPSPFDFVGFYPKHEDLFRRYFRQDSVDAEMIAYVKKEETSFIKIRPLPLEHAILWPEEP